MELDAMKLTPWAVEGGRGSLYRWRVVSAPAPGGARVILYQGDSLEVANLIAAAPAMLKALEQTPVRIPDETVTVFLNRLKTWGGAYLDPALNAARRP